MINFFSHRLFLLIFLLSTFYSYSQDWVFSKEKDGIKIYSRSEPGTNVKAFKGELDVKAPADSVCAFVENVGNFAKCDDDMEEIKILHDDPGKKYSFYVVYDVPWPFKDRDLCVEGTISTDPKTGTKFIKAVACPTAVPENEDYVRMTKYWQYWTIEPKDVGIVHVTMEGYADPAGDIPGWVANLAVTDTPMNILTTLREIVEK
jgi:hypothetical protein